MKRVFLIVLLATSAAAMADNYVTLPGGGGCWVDNGGYAYGCSLPSQENPAQTAAREARNAERLRSERLEKCLRTASWPGMPDREECIQMYRAQ